MQVCLENVLIGDVMPVLSRIIERLDKLKGEYSCIQSPAGHKNGFEQTFDMAIAIGCITEISNHLITWRYRIQQLAKSLVVNFPGVSPKTLDDAFQVKDGLQGIEDVLIRHQHDLKTSEAIWIKQSTETSLKRLESSYVEVEYLLEILCFSIQSTTKKIVVF